MTLSFADYDPYGAVCSDGFGDYRTPFRLYDTRTGRWQGRGALPTYSITGIGGFFSGLGNAVGNFFEGAVGTFGSSGGVITSSPGISSHWDDPNNNPAEPPAQVFATIPRFEPREGAAGYATALPNAVNNTVIDAVNILPELGNLIAYNGQLFAQLGPERYLQLTTALTLQDVANTFEMASDFGDALADTWSPAGVQRGLEFGVAVVVTHKLATAKTPSATPRLVEGAENAGKGALGRAQKTKRTVRGAPTKLGPRSSTAPYQVTPGVKELEGHYINDLGYSQPWRAHYDEYGRLIGRTDYNAGNRAAGIPETHHHRYEWGPGKTPLEIESHVSGEFKP